MSFPALHPEAVMFEQEAFGRPFLDSWWQTETGGITVANDASMAIKPGSMGKPRPGIEARVVLRGADRMLRDVGIDEVGELALCRGWPSMSRAYLHEPERYARCFVDDLNLSCDLVRRDADGYFWFVGRSDDVIKTADTWWARSSSRASSSASHASGWGRPSRHASSPSSTHCRARAAARSCAACCAHARSENPKATSPPWSPTHERPRPTRPTSPGVATSTLLGERGVDAVLPVIFPPQTAIVGFGRIAERPWVVDGQVVARPIVPATLAGDHRATDGHTGARFLASIEHLLQEPASL